MKTGVQTFLIIFCLGLGLILPSQIFASGGGGSTIQRVDPELGKAKKAIEAKDWSRAIELLNLVVARDGGNAESYNLRGFSERMRGNLEAAFKDYERALNLDPKHRGAHEYIGEAYLLVDELSRAEEHLAALDQLCFFSCDEYTDLKSAIVEYKGKHPQ